MKTNKSFGEFVQNVWAIIMRVLMARFCVKYLTLKTRKNAEKYLPGTEKELKLIDKLGFSNEEIAARVWSYRTKVALLHRRCWALISDIQTEEEFDVVLSLGSSADLVSAMRVYTPSRAKMCYIIENFEKRSALQTLNYLISKLPTAFEALKVWEVLGIAEKSYCPPENPRWEVALQLAMVRPVWAPLFMKEIRNIPPQKLGEKGMELMKKFFDIAFLARLDIAEMMPYLYVFFPELYGRVRENFSCNNEISPYFKVMFPQLVKYLAKDVVSSMHDICLTGKLSDKDNAYAWLRIGFERLNERAVYNLLLSQLGVLKKSLLPKIYNQLFDAMLDNACCYSDLAELYRFVDKDNKFLFSKNQELWVSRSEESASRARQLAFAFPFIGWEESFAKRAIRIMVAHKQLKNVCLKSLSPVLQEFAFNVMEEQSQIEALNSTNLERVVTTLQLSSGAEKAFLLMDSSQYLSHQALFELKRQYIERVQLKKEVLHSLIFDLNLSWKDRLALVKLYAMKWQLTLEEYQHIMQSCMSEEAPLLRQYVKDE